MSYEVVNEKKHICPCGKGVIQYVCEENDWSQFRKNVSIQCPKCQNEYEVKSEYFCPKPKHDYTIYYLVKIGENIDSPNTIQLDF